MAGVLRVAQRQDVGIDIGIFKHHENKALKRL
jgi:hypothetical protein